MSDAIQGLDLKQRKEDFVSGLTGGPVLEIYICTLVAASSYFTYSVLQSRFSYFKKPTLLSRLVDISLSWLTPLLSITLYSNNSSVLNILILLPAIITFFSHSIDKSITQSAAKQSKSTKSDDIKQYLPKVSFLTVYRGGMMILTCLAILAVDFKIFPRKFAKVETWGTSLMDLGVGSFVFSMGLVSARATLVDHFLSRKTSRVSAMLVSFRQALSVLALGAIRLLLVKAFNYQEHVTEYGVHWNFFITLGLLPPFVSLFDMFPRKIPLIFISLTIAVGYELLLNKGGLVAYLITAPRDALINKNREGIFSFIGYLSIFLIGKATGFYTLPSSVSIKSYFYPQSKADLVVVKKKGVFKQQPTRAKKVIMLIASGVILQLLYFFARNYFRLIASRRFANLCYILYVCAFNLWNLALFILIEVVVYGNPDVLDYSLLVPETIDSVNANGLPIFLLANVSTGLVNMNVNTIDASKIQSIIILILYSVLLATISLFLWKKGIIIKL